MAETESETTGKARGGRPKEVESFDTTGPTSEQTEAPVTQAAQAEASLSDAKVIKTVHETVSGGPDAVQPLKVNATDGDVVEAANGLPYAGVSADWVKLPTKD